MKIKKGSIKRDIFSKSLLIILLAVFVLCIGIYGLFIANRFINVLIPMNRTVVQFVQINNHFKDFETNLEQYLTIRAESNRIELLNELENTIKLLQKINDSKTEVIINKCTDLEMYLQKIFDREELSSRDENEITFLIYSRVEEIEDLIFQILNQIPEEVQFEAYNYKDKSTVITIVFGLMAFAIITSYMVIGFKLSSTISKPIHDLTNATVKIINGDTSVSTKVNSDNEIGILAASFNEMTSRLQNTLQILKESEKKYRTLFEREGDAIIIFDPVSKQILDTNDASSEIYGYSKDELHGMEYTNLIQEKPDESTKHLASANYIFHLKKDNTSFPVEVNTYDITLGDRKASFIVSRDISEKIRIQEMLIQSEKMMSIGGLAAGMAHEINNPLSNIISLAGIVLNRLTRTDLLGNIKIAKKTQIQFEDVIKYIDERGVPDLLNNIIDSGHKIDEIIKSMLNFSRKDNLKKTLNAIPLLIDETLKLASTNKYYKKINIEKEYETDLPDVSCDHNKIEQVLFNIINNGIQAMEESKIENPQFFISVHKTVDNKYVIISIRDNGQGIDEGIKKRIFEPFFTTKDEGKGTGLGLSISYFIITEYHGGEMSVESYNGLGAEFIIKLPVSL